MIFSRHLMIVVFVLCTYLVPSAQAEFFRIPELVGPAPEFGGGITVNFDLGQEFTEVREVLLLIEATTTPLHVISCGTISNPEECEERIIPIGFFAQLDDPDAGFIFTVIEGFRSDRPVKKAGVFDQVFHIFDFDSLLDGKGELTLFWNQVFFLTGTGTGRSNVPSGEILDAFLVVDGTPVRKRGHPKIRRGGWGAENPGKAHRRHRRGPRLSTDEDAP